MTEPEIVREPLSPAPGAAPWAERILQPPSEWFSTPPARRTWLLRDRRTPNSDGVLPLGKVGQLVAEGGGGKTMALIQLAIAVATGTPWLGALDVVSPGRVLAILGEEDADEVQRRLYNAARATSAPTPALGSIVTMPLAGLPSEMICRGPDGNPTDAAFLVWLRDLLKKSEGWRLILIDPLSRFAGMDAEKDNAQATRFVEALESLAVLTGATVIVAHHSSQSSRGGGQRVGATASRGVTALVDGVRWAATLGVEQVQGLESDARERLGEVVTLSFVKSNYSRRGEPILLRRDLAHGGALVPIDDADEAFISSAKEENTPSRRKLAEREAIRVEREERAAKAKQAKVADREARSSARRAEEDSALRATVSGTPGIHEAELISELRARLVSCSDTSARAAVARGRLAGWLDVRRGPKNALQHFIKEQQVFDLDGGANLFAPSATTNNGATP